MTLTSKPLAVILFVLLFGGIGLSSVLGWWVTESTKVPVTFTEGEFAGQANPADIRGSYTFGNIGKAFEVTPEVLAQAFGINEADPAVFQVKELETNYLDSGYEIGTTSVRLFVAYYTGLPFDTAGQEIYLPQSATDLLLAKGNLTAGQIAYLEAYTVTASKLPPAEQPVVETTATVVGNSPATPEDYTVKGKTTFGELITWGVPQTTLEQLIGGPMPDPAMTVKDYAAANDLNFETLKPSLQAAVDQVKP